MASSIIRKMSSYKDFGISPSPIAVSGTYQIPSQALSCKWLLIEVYRFSRGSSILMSTDTIKSGSYATSTELKSGDNYGYIISVSDSGLITLLSKIGGGTGDPNIKITGLN